MNIEKRQWGQHQGETIWLYSIRNEAIEINLTNYGCTIVSILVTGKLSDEDRINGKQVNGKQVNEKQVNEKQVDERQANERQANDKKDIETLVSQEQVNHKQVNEKQTIEKQVNEKQTIEKQTNEKQVNKKQVKARNVILGYSNFDELVADKYYMGSIVGRFAGRISKSSFEIDGTEFHLPANDGTSGNHLHGGPHGFNKMIFEEVSQVCAENSASITFHGVSENSDQGYPGKVDIGFTISLNTENEINFSYLAKPDQPTHINLTHHLYYNLNDAEPNLNDSEPATSQSLVIDADSMIETTADYIPTGKIVTIPKHADFLISRQIPADIDFNECYVLKTSNKNGLAAKLKDEASGLILELSSTCPAIIFYSGQFLDKPFYPKQGICLEAQYFPDAPNHINFPSTLYNPDKNFEEQTKLCFKNLI